MREEMVRPEVMAVIEDLVTGKATGVLEIEGNPSGRVYLDGGDIAYARASWVPSLAARLRAIAPSVVSEELPPSRDADDAAVAGLVLRHGYLSAASLQELIRSIVVDAFLVLTIRLAEDSTVAAIRFTHTPAYWTGLFPRLGLDVVCGEAIGRAEQMAEYGLAPTTAVAPSELTAPAAVLTREQWAVACQIGDRVSARELAMRRGASLSDTVHCLGSLVRAGLCVPVRPAGRGHVVPSTGHAEPPSPRQEHLATLAVRREPGLLPHPVAQVQPPSLDILRQVLIGLRRLLRGRQNLWILIPPDRPHHEEAIAECHRDILENLPGGKLPIGQSEHVDEIRRTCGGGGGCRSFLIMRRRENHAGRRVD